MSKDRRVSIGPCPVPTYPCSAFSSLKRSDLEEAWKIFGPTAEHNIDKPIWMQLAAAYIEGLNHGSGIERERADSFANRYW